MTPIRTATYTIDELLKLDRPAGYMEDMRRCAVVVDDQKMIFDIDGECFRDLKRKYSKGMFSPIKLSPDVAQIVDLHTRGLGDDVAVFAKAIGADRLAKVYEEITGWSCGCEGRRELLNRLPSLGRMWGHFT